MSPQFNPQIRKHENFYQKSFNIVLGTREEQELSYTQLMHLYIYSFFIPLFTVMH